MFAIIETGGKQYKVSEGDVLFVEKLEAEADSEVTFDKVLGISNSAGFTAGTPWLPVNPNHTTVNAAEQLKRSDSVFHYYQKLISLRRELDVIVYGHYELLEPEHPELFVYKRSWENDRLLTVCSWAEHEIGYTVPGEFLDGECLISNYPDPDPGKGALRPWECFVLLKRG